MMIHINLRIIYTPSHVGIPGNEYADAAANHSHALNTINWPVETKQGAYRYTINEYMYRLWQLNYVITHVNPHYRALRPSIDTPVPRCPQHRAQQVACIRLRSDHTLLAASAHIFNMHDTGLCPCGKSQTTTHMFFDQTCYIYQNKRLTILNKIYTIKPNATLTDILNNSKLLYTAADFILHATGQV